MLKCEVKKETPQSNLCSILTVRPLGTVELLGLSAHNRSHKWMIWATPQGHIFKFGPNINLHLRIKWSGPGGQKSK